ncbi:MAG: hypothetical protein ACRCUP_00765 [Mycoplasmatales bacterium]
MYITIAFNQINTLDLIVDPSLKVIEIVKLIQECGLLKTTDYIQKYGMTRITRKVIDLSQTIAELEIKTGEIIEVVLCAEEDFYSKK